MKMALIHESKYLGEVYIADTFMKRFSGYMLRKVPQYEAIMIKPCNSIHTFFMKFEIDVIFLDNDMKVVKKIEALKPSKMIMPIKESTLVIETKAGKFNSIKVGDIINVSQINPVY